MVKYGATIDNISADVAEAYSVGQVVQQAVTKINSLDNAKLIAELHSSDTFTSVQGPVQFDSTGQNFSATAALFQWQHGKLVPVFPSNVASNPAQFPKADWQ
jgi:branched-chain amino acid transport system substrate-binding protein